MDSREFTAEILHLPMYTSACHRCMKSHGLGALYPCVPNQVSSETERTIRPSGNGLTDAVNLTLASLKALPTWAKIGIPIGLYLLFGDELKQAYRRRRSR